MPPADIPPASSNEAVSVETIVINQAIQDRDGSVQLVQGKSGVAVVYATVGNDLYTKLGFTPLRVDATIRITSQKTGSNIISTSMYPMRDLRNDGPSSSRIIIPFPLTAAQTEADHIEVGLERFTTTQESAVKEFAVSNREPQRLSLVAVPPFRLRVVALRYRYTNGTEQSVVAMPRRVDYDGLASWLKRAFPVAKIEFSYVVTDALLGPSSSESNRQLRALAQVALLRNLDMHNTKGSGESAHWSLDKRTRYYGLLMDSQIENIINRSSFNKYKVTFTGHVEYTPDIPDPTAVSVGPTGQPNKSHKFRWDQDDSYGDWYAGHELGHTLGRRHVRAVGSETGVDEHYPYPDGCIGKVPDDFTFSFGWDAGDASLRPPIQPSFVPANATDIMSYGENQWISGYTYNAILARLQQEEALDADGSGGGCSVTFKKGPFINVILIPMDSKAGQFEFAYVTPIGTGFVPVSTPAGKYLIRTVVATKSGTRNVDTPVSLRDQMINANVPLDRDMDSGERVVRIECIEKTNVSDNKLAEKVVATFSVNPLPAQSVYDLQLGDINTTTTDSGEVSRFRTLTWQSKGVSLFFNVQRYSTGETLAAGLTGKSFDVELTQFENEFAPKIEVLIVYAHNGVDLNYAEFATVPISLSSEQ